MEKDNKFRSKLYKLDSEEWIDLGTGCPIVIQEESVIK